MDLTTLAQLIPSSSRLLLDPGVNPAKYAVSESAEEVIVPTSTVKTGDVLRVLPGERIPVDATVVSGTCCVDESMLTGESKYVSVYFIVHSMKFLDISSVRTSYVQSCCDEAWRQSDRWNCDIRSSNYYTSNFDGIIVYFSWNWQVR